MPTFKILLFDGDGLEGSKDQLSRFGLKRENVQFLGRSPEIEKFYKPTKSKKWLDIQYKKNRSEKEHSVRVLQEIRKKVPKSVNLQFVVASTVNMAPRALQGTPSNLKKTIASNVQYYSSTMKRIKPDIIISTTGDIRSTPYVLKQDKFFLVVDELIGKAAIENNLMYISAIGNSGTIKNQYENSDNRISVLSTRSFSNYPKKDKKGYIAIKEEKSISLDEDKQLKALKKLGVDRNLTSVLRGGASQVGTSFAAPQVLGMILNALVKSPLNIGTRNQRTFALHAIISELRNRFVSTDDKKDKSGNSFREDQTSGLIEVLDEVVDANTELIKTYKTTTDYLDNIFNNDVNIDFTNLLGSK